MCGIAGVVAWDDRFRVSREDLGKMSARIAHRGPDGQGLYLNHEKQVNENHPQVGLVHRRLAIIDLDPRANQPFRDEQGCWIVFNGEIYNFRELRKELANLLPDYAWRTNCDTEVLLAAYAAWGGDCVRHLEGMFAFAIWDESQKSLLLARDRMGQKPLYVAQVQQDQDGKLGAIAFASEVQALLSLGWTNRGISQSGLVEYLSWGHTSAAHSIFNGIRQVRPGTIQVAVDGEISPAVSYWPEDGYPDGRSRPIVGDSQAVASTRELLLRAVKNQLVADVPIGCFLSGGVDSSIIAAAMKAATAPDQRVLTFSIGFDDPRYDEREYAAKVSAHLGTEHRSFVVRPDAACDLPRIATAFGEPFGDSSALPTYYLARETRQHVKVALSGEGGDELFCGYDRYRAMLIGRRLRAAVTPLPWVLAAPLLRHLPGGHPKSRWERARRFASSLGLTDRKRYASYLRLFDDRLLRRLFHPQLPHSAVSADIVAGLFELAHGNAEMRQIPIGDPLLAAMANDRMLYLPDDLLTKVDRCSMQFALEVRSPFMDHQLVQFAAGLTPSQLLKGGPKRMLREAFAADLPEWVFKRKKMGFAVPIGEWFRGELRSMLRDHLSAADSFASKYFAPWVIERLLNEHEQQKVDHSQRLYALLMLELWWKLQKG
jgi:asparagine synthase (glutamine-hydrolysing)